MTLLNVSETWVSLFSFAMDALTALMLIGSLYLLLEMKKNKESNEESQKNYIKYSILLITIVFIFGSLMILMKVPPYLATKYVDYVMFVMIVSMVLAYITFFVLFSRGKVKIDGIRYKLDKRNGTARVLPNKYSGDLVIPSSFINPKDGATYLVTGLDDKAFTDCDELNSVNLPEGVTSISTITFRGCISLNSVTISKSVTSISDEPFMNCADLMSIKVTNGNPKYDSRGNCNAIIETVTNTLVYGCKKSVIPDDVTNIGDSAFGYCVGMTSITIPKSVTSIDDYAFANCENLRDMICFAEQVPSTPNDAFEDTPISEATLHVPAASLEAYKATAPWSQFKNIVTIE